MILGREAGARAQLYWFVSSASQIGWLRIAKIHCALVLGTTSLKSRCRQSHAPSKGFRQGAVLGLSWLLAVPGCMAAQPQSSCTHPGGHVCVQISLCVRAPVLLDQGLILLR